ncbi:MAG: formate dehydrogenase accessory sulfurtransferase FdhD [Ferruginibacter sp.]|nr:formate dehydrogenase accessory sulfurtransferase FdhD [Cytophagales bacterium]
MAAPSVSPVHIRQVSRGDHSQADDLLAVEEPLEIRLGFGPATEGREQKTISVTMRTPGHDFELALGFLFTEGIIQSLAQVQQIRYCRDGGRQSPAENGVRVELAPGVRIDFRRLERHFYTASSCGVCGKTSIEAVRTTGDASLSGNSFRLEADLIHTLPGRLREAQAVFKHTGGLHAAAWFDVNGRLRLLREDVGRHNAVDKLIGAALGQGMIPLRDAILLVSGRASFELVQKAAVAGIPVMAAIGAPSSLAVETARAFGLTLLGFVRDYRYNIYSGEERITGQPTPNGQ